MFQQFMQGMIAGFTAIAQNPEFQKNLKVGNVFQENKPLKITVTYEGDQDVSRNEPDYSSLTPVEDNTIPLGINGATGVKWKLVPMVKEMKTTLKIERNAKGEIIVDCSSEHSVSRLGEIIENGTDSNVFVLKEDKEVASQEDAK